MSVRTLGIVIYLSAAWLPCVSAGGAYCAKTARARAAALGLKFPGDYGAPDLSGPPPYSALHPREQNHRLFQNNPQPPAFLHNPPKEFPHFQPAGYGSVVQPNPRSGLPRGELLNNRQTNFVQVKRVDGPLAQSLPRGQVDFVDGPSESHRNKLEFAYNRLDPAVDAVVLNRHGVNGASGRSQAHVPGYGFHFMPHHLGAGSKPGLVHPMGLRSHRLGGHSAWPMYGRRDNKPRNYPFGNYGERTFSLG